MQWSLLQLQIFLFAVLVQLQQVVQAKVATVTLQHVADACVAAAYAAVAGLASAYVGIAVAVLQLRCCYCKCTKHDMLSSPFLVMYTSIIVSASANAAIAGLQLQVASACIAIAV